MAHWAGNSGDTIHTAHGTLGCEHNTGLTTTVHNLLTQPPILAVYKAHKMQYKRMCDK